MGVSETGACSKPVDIGMTKGHGQLPTKIYREFHIKKPSMKKPYFSGFQVPIGETVHE